MSDKTKAWLKAAGVRAVKTMAEAAITLIPANAILWEVDWVQMAGAVLATGVLTMLIALKGLPEVEGE